MNVAIIVPTLGRAAALAPLVRNIAETTPEGAYAVCFVIDLADRDSRDAARELDCRYVLADGTFPEKTNVGVAATEEPFVLSTADDVVFHPGWHEAAMAAFADPEVCVVGGDDLSPQTNGGGHVTMPIVRRSYLEDPGGAWQERGTIFHEGYHHNYSETELWQLACHRGVARFVPEIVIEHLHPNWGKGVIDATYRRGAFANVAEDAKTFEQRKAQWAAG
jgi:hypothetical protein